MKNSSPDHTKGPAYMSGQAAQEVQNSRVRIPTTTTTADSRPHTDRVAGLDVGLPDSTADLPETMQHHGPRRTVIVAVLGVLALLVAVVLVAVGTSGTESEIAPAAGSYAGDWKDTLIEQSGTQPYTGDWKDTLIQQSGTQPYTGDWKDLLTQPGR